MEKKIVGKYYLVAVDVAEDMTICYKLENGDYLGVVEETIFAVGFNEKYIIAKQHPGNNKSVTNYFIIPVNQSKNFYPDTRMNKALTLEQFNQGRQESGIPEDLTFTLEIENLK